MLNFKIYAAQENNYSENIVYDQPLGLARMNFLMPLKIIFPHTLTVRAQRVRDTNGFVLLLTSFSHRGHFLIRARKVLSLTIWFAQSSRLVLTKLPAGNEEKEEEEVEEEEVEEPTHLPGRFGGQGNPGMPHPLSSSSSSSLSPLP